MRGNFAHEFLSVIGFLHSVYEVRESLSVADFLRDDCAIEVGAESDAVFAEGVEQSIEMSYDDIEIGVFQVSSIFTEESGGEVESDDTVAFFNGVELFLG